MVAPFHPLVIRLNATFRGRPSLTCNADLPLPTTVKNFFLMMNMPFSLLQLYFTFQLLLHLYIILCNQIYQ